MNFEKWVKGLLELSTFQTFLLNSCIGSGMDKNKLGDRPVLMSKGGISISADYPLRSSR